MALADAHGAIARRPRHHHQPRVSGRAPCLADCLFIVHLPPATKAQFHPHRYANFNILDATQYDYLSTEVYSAPDLKAWD